MSKLHGLRAEPPSASARGGAQPVEVGDFLLRRRVGGFLRCSKEGVRRVRRSVRKLQRVRRLEGKTLTLRKTQANLLVPRSLGHGSKTVLQDPLKSSP